MSLEMQYFDNFKEVVTQLKKDTAGLRVTTATVSANTNFARDLHFRKGFYVFNNERLQKFVNRELKNLMNLKIKLTEKRVHDAVERGVVKYVNWLRSYISKMRPPVKTGGSPRRAHPGGWADITGYLNKSYRYKINDKGWKKDPSWT